MSPNRKRPLNPDEESDLLFGETEGEMCPVCHQEYVDGICPINSVDCPYRESADDDLDEEDDPDFEDIENLDDVLKEDEEADRLTEEEDADFAEDLDDDER